MIIWGIKMYTISEELNYNRGKDKNGKRIISDGTPIDDWFYDIHIPDLSELGKQYVLTDYNILMMVKYTEEIRSLIDKAAQNGGGVIVVPAGTYMTGSLFFKQGVNLYIKKAEY